jgi:putative hydrolase of the HAD superfamily
MARPLVEDAKEAGLAVAVCTNDMAAFHDDAWIAHMTILELMDTIVDGSVEHVLKPDPRIFDLVVERLGVDPADCLFVDDQPGNVEGARAVGMTALWFDVTDPERSYAAARTELGLER